MCIRDRHIPTSQYYKELVERQDSHTEPAAHEGIGNALDAHARLPVPYPLKFRKSYEEKLKLFPILLCHFIKRFGTRALDVYKRQV